MGFSTNQVNVLLWVLLAILIVLAISLFVSQGVALEFLSDASTDKYCVGSVCAW